MSLRQRSQEFWDTAPNSDLSTLASESFVHTFKLQISILPTPGAVLVDNVEPGHVHFEKFCRLF